MIDPIIRQSIETKEKLLNSKSTKSKIESLIKDCVECLKKNGKIILAGNGGSFADAQHISAEFTSRFLFERESLASLALGCNNSAISAIGNDYGYELSFARELSSIGNKHDVFIPISTSGNSPNIINAIKVAYEKELKIYGLTGSNKGDMSTLCNCIEVPSSSTPRIQECHILIGHIICEKIEEEIFKNNE